MIFTCIMDSFLALYEVIHPSIKIDVPFDKIQQLDTRIQFIDQYRMDVLNQDQARQELFHIESELSSIFDQLASEDESDPSVWWVIISTGSIIILTLSYVGWRKYKGEREKVKIPPDNNEPTVLNNVNWLFLFDRSNHNLIILTLTTS